MAYYSRSPFLYVLSPIVTGTADDINTVRNSIKVVLKPAGCDKSELLSLPALHMLSYEPMNINSIKMSCLGVLTNNDHVPTIEVPYASRDTVGQNGLSTDNPQITIAGEPYLHASNVYHGNICPENILTEDDAGVCNSDQFNNYTQRLTHGTKPVSKAPCCHNLSPDEWLNAAPLSDVYGRGSVVYQILGRYATSREKHSPDSWLGDDGYFENLWNLYPRYKFTQNHLRYIGTFADARGKPGWIFSTAAKILVDITQTDDMDTWIGQVEGSEERGMFLSNTVEPV